MRRGLAALVLGLLLLAPGVARPWTMADHPRLYLRGVGGAAWEDSLRARCIDSGGNTGSHAFWYSTLKTWIDTQKASNRMTSWVAPLAAMVALVEDTQTYRDYAIAILTYNAANDASVYWQEDSYTPGRIPGCVIGYDWMYPHMTQGQRDAVGAVIGAHYDATDPDTGRDYGYTGLSRYPWIPTFSALQAIIALYGDGDGETLYLPDAVNMFIAQKDKATTTRYQSPAPTGSDQGFLDALDEVSAGGAINGYCGLRYGVCIMNVEALRSSIGTAYADSSAFLQHLGAFWQHRVRSDNVLFSNVGKSNPNDNYVPLYEAWAGSTYRDAAANGMARTCLAAGNQGELGSAADGPLVWGVQFIPWIILWYEPWREHQQYPTEVTFVDEAAGMILARDRWFRAPLPYSAGGDTTTVVHLGFYCGPNQQNASVYGHLYLSRGRDALLTGANGYRDTDTDLHFWLYGNQSLGYNTLSILKPGETIGTTYDPVDCGTSYPDIPEDGQQSDRSNACAAEALEKFPSAGGTFGYGGEFEQVTDTDSVLYARADLTSSFKYQCSTTKASSVKREVVWVKPRHPSEPSIVVVHDMVTRLSASYPVKARFHTVTRPEPASSLCACVADAGGPWSSYLGGVYRVIGSRSLSITRLNSEAQMFVLLPRQGSGTVRLVGGPNRNDISWKQNWESACGNYDATQTSYEYWVNGRNYVGANDPKTRRSTPGLEAADWTIEVQAPSSGTSVEILTAFVVGSGSQARARADLVSQGTAGGRRLVIRQGSGITDIDFGTDGLFARATRRQ